MLDSKKEINKIARSLQEIDSSLFVLKNPLNLTSDKLRAVAQEYQFLQKLSTKLPKWYANDSILGADPKAIEQCSTPKTAIHKFKNLNFKTSLDLTGGYGVDSFFISQKSEKHTYNEINEELAAIVAHNFKVLGANNITIKSHEAKDLIDVENEKYDLVYLDPDRRGDNNNKLVLIENCQPNLLAIQEQLLSLAQQVVVKFSPMLDISLALKQLKNVTEVKIIAIKNDVKELVFYLDAQCQTAEIQIETINFLDQSEEVFSSTIMHIRSTTLRFTNPLKYLYEPNAAVMKSGLWEQLGEAFKLNKLAPHSHFYTSNEFCDQFPGRKYEVNHVYDFNKKTKKELLGQTANVISRNFGTKPEELRRNLKIKEGLQEFLIFTSDFSNKKIVIKAQKINQ